MRLLHAGEHRVEHSDRFGHNLRPDAVARDDREFHDRSTTSSLFAETADLISERTSAGTSRSSRSRIVALGPSASSDSCAAWMFTPAAPSSVPILPSAPG